MSDPLLHRGTEHDDSILPAPNVREADSDEAAIQLRELQQLLFGSSQQRLEQLATEWKDSEELMPRVSDVLPDAISLRSKEDQHLTEAMTPYVVESLKLSARRNPEHISDAIFPILGPAIRKAIAQAFHNLTQTINQTLQHSFTLRGLKWRWEALVSGRSFAEVVLYHSLLYRVEQVLLIHRPTSLLLAHVMGDAVQPQDPELISAMLSAIRDFMRDSFGAGEGADAEFNIEDLKVLTIAGPRALLACAVRGEPSAELRLEMQETLELIHRERGTRLEQFNGDASAFELCRPLLETHLQSRYQAFADPSQQKIPKTALVVLAMLLVALSVWGFFSIRDRLRWHDYLDKLRATNGIILTEEDRGWRRYYVAGLRDPLSVDPAALMNEFSLDPVRLDAHWKEYQAPELAEARAKKLLIPPAGITLNVRDGILYAAGSASQQWILEAQKMAPFIPGINQFRWDEAGAIATLQSEIEALNIRCVGNGVAPGQDWVIAMLAQKIMRLDALVADEKATARINIIGHTDPSGTVELNLSLSQERASQVKAQLEPRLSQLKKTILVISGVRDQQPVPGSPEESRRVSFKVDLDSDK